MTQTKFNPTFVQIQAAHKVFVAMAFLDTLKPMFENIEQQILEDGEYRYHERYFEGKYKRLEITPDKPFIRTHKDTHMMAGLNEYCENQNATNDTARYYSELNRRTRSAGMLNGENSLAIAQNELHTAQTDLINATTSIHKMNSEDVSYSLDARKKIIELILKLFGSLMNSPNLKGQEKKYFDERIVSM